MMISTGRDTVGTLPAWGLGLCTITAKVLEGEVRAVLGIHVMSADKNKDKPGGCLANSTL